MPRKKTKPATTAKTGSLEAEDLQIRALLGEGISGIRACITRVTKMLEENPSEKGAKYNDKLASHLAWLTKNAAQILSEVRKQAAAEAREAGTVSPALVMGWLRQQTAEKRLEIARELLGQDQGEEALSL